MNRIYNGTTEVKRSKDSTLTLLFRVLETSKGRKSTKLWFSVPFEFEQRGKKSRRTTRVGEYLQFHLSIRTFVHMYVNVYPTQVLGKVVSGLNHKNHGEGGFKYLIF